MAVKTTCFKDSLRGGQFEPDLPGQFAPDWGGQLRLDWDGHIERIFQLKEEKLMLHKKAGAIAAVFLSLVKPVQLMDVAFSL